MAARNRHDARFFPRPRNPLNDPFLRFAIDQALPYSPGELELHVLRLL